MTRLLCWLLGVCAVAAALSRPALASEAYVELSVEPAGRISGQMRVSVEELQQALGLEAGAGGEVTWDDLRPHRAHIEAYLASPCAFSVNGLVVIPRITGLSYGVQGDVAQVAAAITLNAEPPILGIDIDCSLGRVDLVEHPRSVRIGWPSEARHDTVINAEQPRGSFDEASAHRDNAIDFIVSGVWHIWIGYDHILFLIALLIPSVLQRSGAGREPASSFGVTLVRVAVIVTAFTITHSITLSLAMVGIVQLPPKWVEAVIAASVALAALNNLRPTTAGAQGVWIALLFGLLHGFGFANVFEEIETGGRFWTALLGFNLGVELGQLAIVAIFVPLAYALRQTRFYRVGVVYGGSVAVAVLACVWLVERLAS